MLNFAQETMNEAAEDMKLFFEKHWKELARNRDIIPLQPNYSKYQTLEKNDKLRIYTIREEKVLKGYAVYFLDTHMHYDTAKVAISDIFWVDPALRSTLKTKIARKIKRLIGMKYKRSIGDMLFEFIEKKLSQDGVIVMHTTFKVAHPAPGKVLKRRKHTLIEHGYAIVLKGK